MTSTIESIFGISEDRGNGMDTGWEDILLAQRTKRCLEGLIQA
jgi:hypothetical protein